MGGGMYKMGYLYKTQSNTKSNTFSEKMLLTTNSNIAKEALAYKIYSDLIEASIINSLISKMIDELIFKEEAKNG
ncbi:MAG: hypothetical protein FWD48_02250 [Oscillospiraceae bacterium]|nr:hypothetical protein [Oscillospiraceae bacterium]